MTLKGGQVCSVFEVARELGKETREIIQEVEAWIQFGVMSMGCRRSDVHARSSFGGTRSQKRNMTSNWLRI
jgi:hypothetical protein